MVVRLVDIGRQHGNSHRLALGDILGNFGRAVEHRGHERRHILFRIVILEPCRLIGDHRIADRVCLVEGVVREVVHLIVDRLCHLRRNAVCLAAADAARGVSVQKRAALFFDVLDLFLGHRPAHHIRLPQRISAELAENFNDLLLIQNAAVSNGKNRLQRRVLVFDQLRVVFAGNEPRNRVHGSRAVSRDNDGKIFDRLRLQAHADACHAGRFHLEHA